MDFARLAFPIGFMLSLLGSSPAISQSGPSPIEATTTDSASSSLASQPDLSAICTDRPTKSNGPCTVPEGMWQVETDILNVTSFHAGGTTQDTVLLTNPTLKYGVNSNTDIEASITPYETVYSSSGAGDGKTIGGIGDLYLRVKYNLINSTDGNFSASLIPYIKLPTARSGIGNGATEGGLIAPIQYSLSKDLTLVAGPELDAYVNAINGGYHLNTSELLNLGYSLSQTVTVYGELWADWNLDPGGTIKQRSFDVAMAWGYSQDLQFDIGLNRGLNRATPAIQVYLGASRRF